MGTLTGFRKANSDVYDSTLFYSYYGGEVIAEVLNQGNFDAFTLGNHEFDGVSGILPSSIGVTDVSTDRAMTC